MTGHQMMWAAAMAQFPVPPEVAAALFQSNIPEAGGLSALPPQRATPLRRDRWSFDGWLLYRPGGGTGGFAGSLPPSYGASQAGGVVNFRLAPGDRHAPKAYVRATQSLAGARESEAALGLSLRPLPALPVRTQAEMRFQRAGQRTEWRPAAFAVTELPPVDLPLSTRGEAYLQAGYVGGDFATLFVDGQARVTRAVSDLGSARLEAGAGAWGGAQKGASRLDIGPTAALDLRVGEVPARLSLDYRQRIAGDAAPQSGAAVTFSVGF